MVKKPVPQDWLFIHAFTKLIRTGMSSHVLLFSLLSNDDA